jgi:hypothetical protein
MTPGVAVEIGGIPILLRSSNSVFLADAREYYGIFVTPTPSVTPIELAVEVDAGGFPPHPDVFAGDPVPVCDLVWSEDRWRFKHYNFRGEWSPETGLGRVYLSHPLGSVAECPLRLLHMLTAVSSGGCLMHAASAMRNGNAFVFPGVSGAGKTTLCTLMPPDVGLLTDEISYIRRVDGGYRAFGTPFHGCLGVPGERASAPLKAIYLLAQGPENKLEDLPRKRAAAGLLRATLFFAKDDSKLINQALETILRLVDTVPVRRLTFVPTPKVWEMIA